MDIITNSMDELQESEDSANEIGLRTPKKLRSRVRKRRRESSSTDAEDVLPDNTLEVEMNLHALAVKNKLDDVSVRKILKKVVTNDHVLAYVKIREEEEGDSGSDESRVQPKLTRAKVKELKKVSPNCAPWNLENLALTPIKHIPVKTRPEVKALIAQEMPEDEDDEEYQPTRDDVPSDDDHTVDESCSDLDSRPRTPATPASLTSSSPAVIRDGPFLVPREIKTPTRRRLVIDEEEAATIALRTRSKLSLSATPIEHIESSFVPPDEVPLPDVDDLWSEFLEECLNPAHTSRNEDDDEADPEYNVAADPDAVEEDEEALENSIIKISKKELSDLVTEIFHIMPEECSTITDVNTTATEFNSTCNTSYNVSSCWEGKREPVSDEENGKRGNLSVRRTSIQCMSIGKSEPMEVENCEGNGIIEVAEQQVMENQPELNFIKIRPKPAQETCKAKQPVTCVKPKEVPLEKPAPTVPLLLKKTVMDATTMHRIEIVSNDPQNPPILPEQILIMQQQLRQHIQLASTNFLQLYVHPVHWNMAPKYKEYLEAFEKIVLDKPNSTAKVCNLLPALDVIRSWEATVSHDTAENREMVTFLNNEVSKHRRRIARNQLYGGYFHDTFMQVVANSSVFLYPHLLPPMPYRSDKVRRYTYLKSEDELIATSLDQFWRYVEDNPEIYKRSSKSRTRCRWGLTTVIELVCVVNFTWLSTRSLFCHVMACKRTNDPENPIMKFFQRQEITPVKHKLVPYNPASTLYDQPEHEMPLIWIRHLAKTSKRAKDFLRRRSNRSNKEPNGVELNMDGAVPAQKTPIPTTLVSTFPCTITPMTEENKQEVNINFAAEIAANKFTMVQIPNGIALVPIIEEYTKNPEIVNGNFSSEKPQEPDIIPKSANSIAQNFIHSNPHHCNCCLLLKKIRKLRQTTLREYFCERKSKVKCPCESIVYPKLTKRLCLFINSYKSAYEVLWRDLESRVNNIVMDLPSDVVLERPDDTAFVIAYQSKLKARIATVNSHLLRKEIYGLLSKFDLEGDSPEWLMGRLERVFEKYLDLRKEFVGFLTAEQADKVKMFKDYFIIVCVPEFVKKIEEEITDKVLKVKLLSILKEQLTEEFPTSCDICMMLLPHLKEHPKLAEYLFNMFPHRLKAKTGVPNKPTPKKVREVNKPSSVDHDALESVLRYESDDSIEVSRKSTPKRVSKNNKRNSVDHDALEGELRYESDDTIDNEDTAHNDSDGSSENSNPMSIQISDVATLVKDENQQDPTDADIPKSQNTSLSPARSDSPNIIKIEQEWRKDEDKVILEVLKDCLHFDNNLEKRILNVLEDEKIVCSVLECLPHRSVEEIEERVSYLLDLLVINSGGKM